MTTIRATDAARGIYEVSSGGAPTVWNVTRRFTVTEWVGGGSYGQVCRGTDRDNHNAPIVIKRISNVFGNAEDAMRILREVAILRRLDHPNIIKVVDVIEPEPNTDAFTRDKCPFHVLYIVFADGGIDLRMWMESFQDDHQLPRPTGDVVRHLMKQMVGAFGYIHRCRVVHRDIKPANILIDPVTLTLRIADFGLSRVIEVTDEEEHQGHHHRVWNFERPRAPSVDEDMDEASPHASDTLDEVVPLERGDSGSFDSDDSDVESDSPSLLVRASTQVVVTRWCQTSTPQRASNILYLLTPLRFKVPRSRGRPVQRQLQPSDRRVECRLHIRGAAAMHAARLNLFLQTHSLPWSQLPLRNKATIQLRPTHRARRDARLFLHRAGRTVARRRPRIRQSCRRGCLAAG